jgi:hypothetical protein
VTGSHTPTTVDVTSSRHPRIIYRLISLSLVSFFLCFAAPASQVPHSTQRDANPDGSAKEAEALVRLIFEGDILDMATYRLNYRALGHPEDPVGALKVRTDSSS